MCIVCRIWKECAHVQENIHTKTQPKNFEEAATHLTEEIACLASCRDWHTSPSVRCLDIMGGFSSSFVVVDVVVLCVCECVRACVWNSIHMILNWPFANMFVSLSNACCRVGSNTLLNWLFLPPLPSHGIIAIRISSVSFQLFVDRDYISSSYLFSIAVAITAIIFDYNYKHCFTFCSIPSNSKRN